MTAHLNRMIAKRAQRLARMNVSQAAPASIPADRTSDRLASSETIAGILSRVEAIELVLAVAPAPSAEPSPRPRLAASQIEAAVCRRYGLTAADLAHCPRPRAVSRARYIAIYLARRLTGKSFRTLARIFGDRAHPSVIRAFRTIERLRSVDPAVDRDVRALAAELGSALPTTAETSAAP